MEKRFDIALSFAMQEKELVERVYHYLRAEGYSVFFAPSSEAQEILSGRNQREVFYEVFGLQAEYVALFVSAQYIQRPVTMEECEIAIKKHGTDGKVVAIYLDGTELPNRLLDPKETNYYSSNSAIDIATHLANKMRREKKNVSENEEKQHGSNTMVIKDNNIKNNFVINHMEGDIAL